MRYTTVFATALVLVSPASGHHSNASMNRDSVVSFEGTITQFNWQNPHVYFIVETTNGRGEQVEWTVQTDSTNIRARRGWTRESLSSGDRVALRAYPAQDGRRYALLISIEKEGGIVLPMASEALEVTASTLTLEGVWMADTSKLARYAGGLAGFFNAQLELTEKGTAAQVAFSERSDENPGTTCIGMPTPLTIVTTHLYPLEIQFNEDEETIVIRSEFFDEERTVYMDGRGHPEGGDRILTGHSIGWWDGDVLVVDTRNFADHRSPYQSGVPSGAQKHVVERYRLTEDGTRIAVEFMLEDPEYVAEPMTHTRELIYSPHLLMSRYDCDPQTTRRFLH